MKHHRWALVQGRIGLFGMDAWARDSELEGSGLQAREARR